MPFQGYLDRADQFAIQGWAHSESVPSLIPFVDIVVNRRCVATVRAGVFRQDLVNAGMGDGRRGFWFNPYESLQKGMNHLEVFISGSDQHLPNGIHTVTREVVSSKAGVGWARPLPKQAVRDWFLEQVKRMAPPSSGAAVLEIGPGGLYGERAGTAAGLDMLGPKARFDLVLCAGQSEGWAPSIAEPLRRIYECLKPGGTLVMDFPYEEGELAKSYATGEQGNFRRVYSESELRSFFLEAGFELIEIATPDFLDPDARALVAATKPEVVS